MIQVRRYPIGPLQTNCYLAGCEQTKKAAVIDPSWNGAEIAERARKEGWQISHILLTHSHFDHVGGLAELKEATNAPVYIHQEAVDMLSKANLLASLFGINIISPPPPDELLSAGQIVSVGKLNLHTLYTPGHAPGHVSFSLPDFLVVFDGDVLFQDSIGRYDFPDSDYDTLMDSIWQQLMTLPDETKVFSGHGPETTIGRERQRNPFLQDRERK
jgi:glyoxylase-like metal-dependent hydrolase (beta-lactamase superfamily II)